MNDLGYGLYEAQCLGCDQWGPVDDMGLCKECAGKFERDMIRLRNWDYSAMAFGTPPEKYEELRQWVIQEHGDGLELVAPEDKPSKKRRSKKCRKR